MQEIGLGLIEGDLYKFKSDSSKILRMSILTDIYFLLKLLFKNDCIAVRLESDASYTDRSTVKLISNPDLPRPGGREIWQSSILKYAYWQQGPIYGPCCYCAWLNKLLWIWKAYVNNGGYSSVGWRGTISNRAEARRGVREDCFGRPRLFNSSTDRIR